MDLDAMSIEQLGTLLDEIDADRLALKERGRQVMEVRARKIAAESLHAREHPTQVVGLPDQGRLKALRARAGVAEVGVARAGVAGPKAGS